MEPGAVRSADGWFRLMVETDLAPGLRALGFTGAGRHYRIVGEAHLGELSIVQADLGPHSTRFTLALGVVPTDEWTAQRRVRPYLPRAYAKPQWRERIGDVVLVDTGTPIGDLWWQVDAGKPFGALTREVLAAVREFALPALRDQLRLRAT